jgi:hypothetical protein
MHSSYQNILFDNIEQLANFVLSKRYELQFNIPIVTIQSEDVAELQQ